MLGLIVCACASAAAVGSAAAPADPAAAAPTAEPADGAAREGAPSAATIVVTAPASDGRVLTPGVLLGPDALVDRQPRTAADALRGLPGVSVRTNSRGETVPRVRGSEERQTAVFLDGAPLVVPWDGRIDLGLLPAGILGRIEVRKGAVPIEYGANAVAGVVDLQSRRPGEGSGFLGIAQLGTLGIVGLSGVLGTRVSGAELTLAAGLQSQDAAPVADLAALPFSQDDSGRRTNTRSDAATLFGAIGGEVGPVALRVGLLSFQAERGIAPESDRDPVLFAPRYWRYPDIRLTQATVSAEVGIAPRASLRAVVWRQWFGQVVNAYRTVDYASLRAREENEDDTLGARLTVTIPAGPVRLRWSGSAQTGRHVQVDTPFPPGTSGPRLHYRQDLLSLGAEADFPLGGSTMVTAGIGYDRSANPDTGDKPPQPAADALAFSANLRRPFGDKWTLTLSGGRRTRFPSARELFGEALGRFLPNGDLRPEKAWLADAELTFRDGGLTATLNPFVVRTTGTISQRIVRVGGQDRRQRFNLDGATALGLDFLFLFRGGHWSAELTGSLLRARADRGDATFRRLVQRPGYEIGAAMDWAPGHGLDVRTEVHLTGSAVDLAPNGDQARLPASAEINLRASLAAMRLRNGSSLSLTLAVDNVTDALVLPQLGLPRPGRTIRLGFRVS